MLVMSIGMMSGVVGQATVTSDKPDYAPRSNAVFTGAGFQAFEQVQLKVKNLNSPCNTVSADSSYLPWTVTADANGAFVTNWTVCDCPGDSLRLKATGQTSGFIATHVFYDGAGTASFDESYIVMNINGLGNTFYDLNLNTLNPDFNNVYFGTFCGGSWVIVGGESKIKRCGVVSSGPGGSTTCSFSAAKLYYRVYPTGSPNSFVPISLSFNSSYTPSCPGGPGNNFGEKWQSLSGTTNILSGLTPGNYTIEVYADANYQNCNGNSPNSSTIYNSNSSNNFKATFTVATSHTLLHNSGATTQSICEGLPIESIVYTFGGGATGVNVSGLPAGVTTSTVGNTVTISGTPTVSFGTFNYTVTTTGNSCTAQSLGGTITVKSKLDVINLDPPLTPTICFGNSYTAYSEVYEPGVTPGTGPASPNIISEFGYGTTNNVASFTWATASFNGPASLYNFDGYMYTFTPAAAGTYYYTFRYSFNGCDWQYTPQVGTLTVDAPHTLSLTSGDNTQEPCEGTSISDIKYTFGGGATGVNVSGLPAGVSSSITGNVLTITGTPTVQFGTYNYTVTTTGGSCATQSLGGTITVKSKLDYVNLQFPLTDTKCLGQSLTAYGQVYEPGVTPGAGAASPNIIAEYGYGTVNNTSSFTWATASFNAAGSTGNNDEYQYVFTPTATGTYYYTFRYSFNGCDWQYASDIGVLTVNEAPAITTVYNNITVNNDPGVCGAVVTYAAASATGIPAPGITYSHASGSVFPVGITTVTVTATNSCGTDTKTFTVTVNDTENPTIVGLPSNITQSNDAGVCGAVVTWVAPTSADNCSGSTIAQTAGPASGSTFPVGTTTITYTATDAAGNTYSASFTVTVNDTENPTIVNLPSNITQSNDAGVCGAVVTWVAPTSADNCSGVVSVSSTHNPGDVFPVGNTTVTYTFTDANNNSSQTSFTVTVIDNTAPVWTTTAGTLNRTIYCGQSSLLANAQALTPVATDNCGGTITVTKIAGAFVPLGGGGSYTNTWTAIDAAGNISTIFTQVITVDAITVDASTSSTPVPLGTAAILSATVSPAASGITVVFTLDDGNGNIYTYSGVTDAFGKVTASTESNLPLEVYKITAVAGSGCATSIAYLPIYDPNGNFVTGGGWINSPAGALTADPLIVGKANFGFVSKYKKGSSIVDGNTEFQFHAGDINFKSTMHESGSLVISGAKATYRGTGTINGLAGYKFTIVAIDGNWNNGVAPDKFRIKITTTTGQVVYDNQMGKDDNADDATVLGGGSIVIHEVKKKTANRMEPGVLILTPQEFGVKVIGNPSITTFRLQLQSNNMQEKFTVKVVDLNGRLIEVQQNLYAGQVIELGSKYTQGTYFAEVMQGTNRKVVKLIKIGRD